MVWTVGYLNLQNYQKAIYQNKLFQILHYWWIDKLYWWTGLLFRSEGTCPGRRSSRPGWRTSPLVASQLCRVTGRWRANVGNPRGGKHSSRASSLSSLYPSHCSDQTGIYDTFITIFFIILLFSKQIKSQLSYPKKYSSLRELKI